MRKLIAVLVLFSLVASIGCSAMDPTYVKADEETYQAIADYYCARVDSDANLSPAQKKDRKALIRSWRARLNRAEGAPVSATAAPEEE